MTDVKWTPQQTAAMDITDKNLLISASAGSGKTAVLVERLIRMITKKELETDKLLAITFTKAAAGELRQRIRKALKEKISSSSGEDAEYFLSQIEKLDAANISTLHSFCYGIIKKYYHIISVDPQVKIMRDEERSILYMESMDELFEEYYTCADNFFIEFIDTFSDRSDDISMKENILNAYDELRNIADYKTVIKNFAGSYPTDEESFNNSPAAKFITEECGRILKEARTKYRKALNIAIGEDDEKMDVVNSLQAMIDTIDYVESQRNISYKEFINAYKSTKFPEASRKRKIGRIDEIRSYRDGGKSILDELKKFVPFDFSYALYYTTAMQPYVMKFVEILLRFEDILNTKKLEKKLVDYSDLEHLCLEILKNDSAREEIRNSFSQVLVDEYQDINGVQEMIIQSVTNENNLFMVGDIKQSIYRFRQADPGIFYDKYVKFSDAGEDDLNKLIHLNRNFRSSKIIIGFVNMLFSAVMFAGTGGVNFYPDEIMVAGADIDTDEKVKLRLIDCTEIPSDEEIEDNREAEAIYVANLIKNEILTRTFRDGDKYIRYSPSDIVVIDRSMKAKSGYFLKALENAGLSANIIDDGMFYDNYEVSLIINYLRIIDNELNDIALLSVMRSFLYNFSEDDITLIRKNNMKSMYYYEAVYDYLVSGEDDTLIKKINRLYGDIRRYRSLSRHISIRELIEKIYEEKYIFPFISSLPDGDKRTENLYELLDITTEYETSHTKGLYDFIVYADKCKETMKRKPASEDKDGVRLMTTHSSKGLEFDVVIVTGCGTQIRSDSSTGNIFIDKDYGICPKFTDMQLGYRTSTTEYTARQRSISLKNKAEEMRILYVAATRAKKVLYLTAAVDKKENLSKVYTDYLGEFEITKISDYLGWIKYSSDMNPDYSDSVLEVSVVKPYEEGKAKIRPGRANIYEDDYSSPNDEDILRKNYSFVYPHHSAMIPTKLSVSALKDEINISADRIIERKPIRESLEEASIQKKAMQRGTMIHRILELSDMDLLREGKYPEAIEEAIRLGRLPKEDISHADKTMIADFFATDLGRMMINADSVHREQPFILKEYARNINPLWEKSEDSILIQGIIDCWFEYGGEYYIVDFKTDRIKDEVHLRSLNEKYSVQLGYYRKALEEYLKKDIRAAYICYLRKNIIVNIGE